MRRTIVFLSIISLFFILVHENALAGTPVKLKFKPGIVKIKPNQELELHLYADSKVSIGAFDYVLNYPDNKISIESFEAGIDGNVAASNLNVSGQARVSGLNPYGMRSGKNVHLLIIKGRVLDIKTKRNTKVNITLIPKEVVDKNGYPIKGIKRIRARVIILPNN